jgi:hypothetical protein
LLLGKPPAGALRPEAAAALFLPDLPVVLGLSNPEPKDDTTAITKIRQRRLGVDKTEPGFVFQSDVTHIGGLADADAVNDFIASAVSACFLNHY